jgi:hypothetical protein
VLQPAGQQVLGVQVGAAQLVAVVPLTFLLLPLLTHLLLAMLFLLLQALLLG